MKTITKNYLKTIAREVKKIRNGTCHVFISQIDQKIDLQYGGYNSTNKDKKMVKICSHDNNNNMFDVEYWFETLKSNGRKVK